MVEKGPDGTLHPVVMDFGLAREAGEGKGLTESGAVLGTPAYMSPEQARGDVRNLDHRTDVYSLGATLFDILTGVPPFDDEAVVKILIQVINAPPPLLRAHNSKLPEALELIVSKCLNKEAAQRYSTAKALADDLDRFLSAGRVTARRLGYGYRIRYFARHNRALFALALALALALVSSAAFFTYTRIVNARKAAQAQRQAELFRELGKEIKDLEWLMRVAHALPIHDIEREKAQVRQRMAELSQRFADGGEAASGLIAYGRGRGHLALHEYKQAYAELCRAESLGTLLPELHLALGRVKGELFEKALQDARRSGDASFFEKRRQELEKEFLEPALRHLAAVKRSGARVESPHYLEGLIAFYTKQPELALRHADAALAKDGWLYEAQKLSADVVFSRALDEKDSGLHDAAEKDFQDAILRYEKAAEIGRSDHELYEAIAEAWIRQMEIDVAHGRDPQAKHAKALQAAEKAISSSSKDNFGYTKQAFSNYFASQFFIAKDEQNKSIEMIRNLMNAGRKSIDIHSNDAYSHEIIGLGYVQKSQLDTIENQFASAKENLTFARDWFLKSIAIDNRFPWAYNDQALTYIAEFNLDMQYGNEKISNLEHARNYLEKAIHIDNKYFNAYANLAETNRLYSQWLVEHGQNPSEFVKFTVHAATTSLKINENNPNAYGIIGMAYLSQMQYLAMSGLDVSEFAVHAKNAFDRLIRINSTNVYNYEEAAQVVLLKTKNASARHPQDRQEGLRLLAQCRKLDTNYAPCLWGEAQFIADNDWKRAYGLAKQAILRALPEQAAEANFVLSTLIYERLTQRSAPPAEQSRLLKEGLMEVKLALAQNHGWARALALQGGLAWLGAKREKDSAHRQELIRLAGDSLKRAFAGNPLLLRQYEAVEQDVLVAIGSKTR